MLFDHYVRINRHYCEILGTLEEVIEEEARLFQRTQPHGITGEVIGGSGGHSDRMAQYVAKKAELEESRKQTIETAEAYASTLRELRARLLASEDETDRVFVARYIKRQKIHQVAARLCMSEATVYRVLRRIRMMIEKDSLGGV